MFDVCVCFVLHLFKDYLCRFDFKRVPDENIFQRTFADDSLFVLRWPCGADRINPVIVAVGSRVQSKWWCIVWNALWTGSRLDNSVKKLCTGLTSSLAEQTQDGPDLHNINKTLNLLTWLTKAMVVRGHKLSAELTSQVTFLCFASYFSFFLLLMLFFFFSLSFFPPFFSFFHHHSFVIYIYMGQI